ncbi:MAG: Na/Pi symporter [Bacteroidia bacterium]|nr:Na/Pi symporter [Bacteroidia bacterium]MDW8300919.1 Na/Pi symporter [Bacteroidia bacterium]
MYGLTHISQAIQASVGHKASVWILKFTKNIFLAVLVGIVVTTLLDSSSAVIIITIVLVNSKVISFRQAMGVVLGANIGTTVSSQIIAMDVGKYSPLFLLIGFIVILISKTARLSNIGKIILYFGIIFFGLHTMEQSVAPLKQSDIFMNWLSRINSPIEGALLGALITIIIQSSSATVGIAIVLVKKGLLSIAMSIAVMIGAELGTCSDTLLATIRSSPAAIKTGLFHLIFNLISAITGLILFYYFVDFVIWTSGHAPPARIIANAHVWFNVLGVLFWIWVVPVFERLLNRILPEKT